SYTSPHFHSLRPPPRPPLFPSTTLFRSAACTSWRVRSEGPSRSDAPLRPHVPTGIETNTAKEHMSAAISEPGAEAAETSTSVKKDRKSTRLNSSHVSNSYAVFCLKKKNN